MSLTAANHTAHAIDETREQFQNEITGLIEEMKAAELVAERLEERLREQEEEETEAERQAIEEAKDDAHAAARLYDEESRAYQNQATGALTPEETAHLDEFWRIADTKYGGDAMMVKFTTTPGVYH